MAVLSKSWVKGSSLWQLAGHVCDACSVLRSLALLKLSCIHCQWHLMDVVLLCVLALYSG